MQRITLGDFIVSGSIDDVVDISEQVVVLVIGEVLGWVVEIHNYYFRSRYVRFL